MKRILPGVAMTMLVNLSLNAQFKERFTLQSWKVSGMYALYNTQITDYSAIISMARKPGELSIPADIDRFNRRSSSQQGSSGKAVFSAQMGFQPRNLSSGKPIRQQLLLIGLEFRDQSSFETAYSSNERLHANTDTFISREYYVESRQKLGVLSISWLWKTDPDKIVQGYLGVGMNTGLSLASQLTENTSFSYIYSRKDSVSTTFIPQQKRLSGKMVSITECVIPVGFHARVHKNWGVTADLRMIWGFNRSGGGQVLWRPMVQTGVGIQYTFGRFPNKKPADEIEEF